MKVTDRRLFNPDGEIRDEYRQEIEDREAAPPEPVAEPAEVQPPEPSQPAPALEPLPEVEGYPAPSPQGPTFFELIGLIAEPASIYLREASMGRSGELRAAQQQEQNLELARLHIDLLGVLRERTAGQLDAREQGMLDDLIQRLRMGFVQIQQG